VSLRDALSIAIPAVGLLLVALPGRPRWLLRPWFAAVPPRRWWLGLFLGALLLGATVHAIA